MYWCRNSAKGKQTNKQKVLHLGIVDEIDGEDEDANATVDQVEHLHVDPHEGEDGDHEAEEDEDEKNTEEDPTAQSEVDLCLKNASGN